MRAVVVASRLRQSASTSLPRATINNQRLILQRTTTDIISILKQRRYASSSSNDPQFSDVTIVGGGVVGCALARQLRQRLPSLSVHLIEARNAPTATAAAAPTTDTTATPHPRSYALSPQSLSFLGLTATDNINNNSDMAGKVKMGAYDTMQIWEARNPATLRFHTDDLEDTTSDNNSKILGAVVEDGPLVKALWESLEQTQSIHSQNNHTMLSTNTTVKEFQLPSAATGGLVTLETSKGEKHQTRLLVAADGAQSPIRQKLGIPQVQYDYGRQALTFTVELEQADRLPRTAYQRFVHHGDGSGPLALLPTHSPRHAIVVWSTTPEVVQKWKTGDEDSNEALVQHLQSLLQQGPQRLPPLVEQMTSSSTAPQSLISNVLFGVERVLDTVQDAGALMAATASPTRGWMAPPRISKIVSPKLSFPLACRNVPHYQDSATSRNNQQQPGRVVLVGDAAHTVHPMAGQGLNLGLGAVQSLVESLVQAESVGMDLTYGLDRVLQKQHAANTSAILGIHTLHEIFAVQGENVPMMHAKSFGMNVLQNIGPLRRKVVQAATQGVLL